jgi:hypothetical protein
MIRLATSDRPACPHCNTPVRLARDAAGRVEFDYCPACGLRRYFNQEAGLYSEWADDDTWRLRHHARRVVDIMLAAAKASGTQSKEAYRHEVFGLVAQWLGEAPRGGVGRGECRRVTHWHEWTRAQCLSVLKESEPVVAALADAFVHGGDRLALHTLRARRSWLPRVTLLALLAHDRLRAWWRATLEKWRRQEIAADMEDQ